MSPRILVIDDDADVVTMLALHLDFVYGGSEVHTAYDGPSGFRMATETGPDLVILDFNMPGADGAQVLALLRANAATAAIPAILMTARPLHDVAARFPEDPRLRFLQKPLDFKTLDLLVQDLLGKMRR